ARLPGEAAAGDEGAVRVVDAQALDDHRALVAVADDAPGAAGESRRHDAPRRVRVDAVGGGVDAPGHRRLPAHARAAADAAAEHAPFHRLGHELRAVAARRALPATGGKVG